MLSRPVSIRPAILRSNVGYSSQVSVKSYQPPVCAPEKFVQMVAATKLESGFVTTVSIVGDVNMNNVAERIAAGPTLL